MKSFAFALISVYACAIKLTEQPMPTGTMGPGAPTTQGPPPGTMPPTTGMPPSTMPPTTDMPPCPSGTNCGPPPGTMPPTTGMPPTTDMPPCPPGTNCGPPPPGMSGTDSTMPYMPPGTSAPDGSMPPYPTTDMPPCPPGTDCMPPPPTDMSYPDGTMPPPPGTSGPDGTMPPTGADMPPCPPGVDCMPPPPPTAPMPPMEPMTFEQEAEGLYYCIDSHGQADGMVSLLELAGALYMGAEAGVIPMEAIDSFGENVDVTGLMMGHLDGDEFEACAAGDGVIMARELGECVEGRVNELVAAEDWAGLDTLMERMHKVEISKDDALSGLQATLQGIEGLDEADWASEIQAVSQACWEAHYPQPDIPWEIPAEQLYDCIDLHGDMDGQMSVLELGIALEQGVEAGAFPQEAVDAFAETVDMTGLMSGHMGDEEFGACAGDDDTLMAGELMQCAEDYYNELAAANDTAGIDELFTRLNDVKISKEDAAEGLEATLRATGAPEEEWSGYMMHAAEVCFSHLPPPPTAPMPPTDGTATAPLPPTTDAPYPTAPLPPTTDAPPTAPVTTAQLAQIAGKKLASMK